MNKQRIQDGLLTASNLIDHKLKVYNLQAERKEDLLVASDVVNYLLLEGGWML